MMSYLGRIREQAECLYGDSGAEGLDSVVSYCCITSYHKPSGFKQHTLIFSVCVGKILGMALHRVSQSYHQGVSWGGSLI